MAPTALLTPTLHIEVMLTSQPPRLVADAIRQAVADFVRAEFEAVPVGKEVAAFDWMDHAALVHSIVVADYTGPSDHAGFHDLSECQLDVQTYSLRITPEPAPRRRIGQPDEEQETSQARVLDLPNVLLQHEWESLVFDVPLPSQLLRYLARMLAVMKQPGLHLSTFNWNRLCLLHGPPGSGKSTLCRALAQKMSVRLNRIFPHASLVEVNPNAMLSKYFGESGKLIASLFDSIHAMAQQPSMLVCVVMDEVETIAASRKQASAGGECNDGLRATNQLLTALDRMRTLPNVIVLCTSNLLEAVDPAFLDRVDMKQLIPTPSPAAIYNIFRSCLNELVRCSLVDLTAASVSSRSAAGPYEATQTHARNAEAAPSGSQPPSSSPEKWTLLEAATVPAFAEMQIRFYDQPQSPGQRVWALAQRCEGLSGRTLRRLPILGLTMYTWGGICTLQDAISALEAAVNQELLARPNNSGLGGAND